jgi:hypothetical protein
MRRPPALPLAALALTAAALPARADPPPRVAVRLDYVRGSGAESCPATDDALRAEVGRRMGYDPFEPSSAERLAVVLTRDARGWAATLERSPASGARPSTFRRAGEDCAAFTASLALEIRALLLQGGPGSLPANGRLFGVDGYDPPVRPREPGAQLIAVAPVEPPRDAAQPPLAPSAPKRLELAASGNLVLTGEPFVTGGAALRAALRWTWLSAGAELRFDAGGGASASGIMGAPNARYQGRTIAGAIVPCAVYEHPSVQPFACAVLSGGAMTETGTGVDMPGTDTGFILATGPRVGFDVPLHVPRVGLALRTSFDALFFPVGARFHLAGSEVWKTPLVSGVAGVGLAVFL